MELFNRIKAEREGLLQSEGGKSLFREAVETMIMLLSPFAPHMCEELWEHLGSQTLLAQTPWPSYEPELAKEERVTIVVQINGKLRDRFQVERDTGEEKLEEMALSLDRIRHFIGDKEVKKVIPIKNKLVNIVI